MADSLDEKDNAGVRFPPPLIYIGMLLLGFAFGGFIDERFIAYAVLTLVVGMLFILSGAIMLYRSLASFRRAENDPKPWKPANAFVATGIYTRTRNPMYLAMALIYLGFAIGLQSWGALILFLPTLWLIQHFVIGREEAYLERKFGQSYLDYRANVRRWI